MHDAASLADDLRRLGVRPGDALMAHASLRRTAARAEAVIEAVAAAVGPEGTMLMTLGADDPWGWVNERPEHERAALLADAPEWDAATAATDPDMGVLAEVFRTYPGTVVSDHPEGRFGARGRLAVELTSDQPWDDYYGPGSPLERFVAAGGRVMRLGADVDTVTLLHWAEYLAVVPDKRRVRRHRRMPDGVRAIECLDDSDGIVDRDGDDYFGVILADYLGSGRATVGRVGGAAAELLDGPDLVAFAATWMTERFG